MKILTTVICAIGVAASAMAAEISPRFYIGGDAGFVIRELDGDAPLLAQPGIAPGSRVTYRKHSDDAQAYVSIHGGVRVTDYFSVQVGYQELGDTYLRITPPPNLVFIVPPPEHYRFHERSITVDPILTIPVSSRVKVYGFWGVVFNRVDVHIQDYFFNNLEGNRASTKNSRASRSRLGAGALITLIPRLDLRVGLDYQKFGSYTKEGWLGHGGVNYTF